jgi:2-oxoisovalerate dehydrogenase E1 component alpha subunit
MFYLSTKVRKNQLLKAGLLKEIDSKKIWEKYEAEGLAAQQQARTEPAPTAQSIWDHTYANSENSDWRKF